jgi:hypothetical protein
MTDWASKTFSLTQICCLITTSVGHLPPFTDWSYVIQVWMNVLLLATNNHKAVPINMIKLLLPWVYIQNICLCVRYNIGASCISYYDEPLTSCYCYIYIYMIPHNLSLSSLDTHTPLPPAARAPCFVRWLVLPPNATYFLPILLKSCLIFCTWFTLHFPFMSWYHKTTLVHGV